MHDFTDTLDTARERATIGDDLLRLIFTACHPVLSSNARVALTLKLPGGLTTHGIARAYLVPQSTIAQRIVRAKRSLARTDAQGNLVLLNQQNRARWDHLLIRRGLAALDRAQGLGQCPGSYQLQATIAACHARAPTAQDTDWARIAALYAVLMRVTPSPVVELNRAVAVSLHEGPAVGLAIVETLLQDKALRRYHQLHAVHGDLLQKLGHREEARAALRRAVALAGNDKERALQRALLVQRAQE